MKAVYGRKPTVWIRAAGGEKRTQIPEVLTDRAATEKRRSPAISGLAGSEAKVGRPFFSGLDGPPDDNARHLLTVTEADEPKQVKAATEAVLAPCTIPVAEPSM